MSRIGVLLFVLLAIPATASRGADRIEIGQEVDTITFRWRDAEDVLQGAMQPLHPRADEPVRVSLRVGTVEGQPFNGPVHLTFRPPDEPSGQALTVEPVEGTWAAEFVPTSAGPHQLEVRFLTTRHKSLKARVEVGPARIPRMYLWGFVAVGALLLLCLGAWRLLRAPVEAPPIQ